jgi:hypothetical protein
MQRSNDTNQPRKMKTQTLRSTVEKEIEQTKANITRSSEKLQSNYLHGFEWGYAGDIYKLKKREWYLNALLAEISKDPDLIGHYLANFLTLVTADILKGSFIGRSSSVYSNLSEAHDKEVACEMIELYGNYLKWVSDEKDPMPIN